MPQELFTLTAKTFSGLEEVLASELKSLGANNVKAGRRAVSFTGDQQLMMKANLWTRTSLNILRHVNTFRFDDRDSFFGQMLETPWSACFDAKKTISVYAVASRSELFTNTMFLGQLTKDAVVDHFRDKTGIRPDVDPHNAEVRINVYINGDTCVVSLDSSGDSLFRRGYRRAGNVAPLNEVLAAGLISLSGWDRESDFFDPMCGSGTFSVEAALMAANVAPGTLRKSFAFMNWKDYDPDLFGEIRKEALDAQTQMKAAITASDINIKGLDLARQNIMEAGLLGQIRVQKNDFFTFQPPSSGGWVLLNPPYGQRIRQSDLPNFYKRIGDTLKQNFQGFYAGIISQEINRLKHVGLKPRKRYKVFNGPLECLFMVYELFQGTHKAHVISTRPRRPRI